jgi:hypothetical protein
MTQAGVGKVVQTLGIKKKDGEEAPKAGGTSVKLLLLPPSSSLDHGMKISATRLSPDGGFDAQYDPPSLGDISSNYVRMAGLGGAKAAGSASSAQAYSSGTPGKLALPAGNSQPVMGGTDDGGSQLRCYNCTVIMSYPPGATKVGVHLHKTQHARANPLPSRETADAASSRPLHRQVKCPTCESINATAAPGSSPAPSSSNNISVSCSGCHQPTICPSTTKRLVRLHSPPFAPVQP